MAEPPEKKINNRTSENAARIRENFSIWNCPVTKPSKPEPIDTSILTQDDDIINNNSEKEKEEEVDSDSAITVMIEKLSQQDISPSQSSDETAIDRVVLPLSTANLIKATEDEEQRLLSGLTKSYSLTEMEIREALQNKRMKKWIARANPDGRLEDTASASYRSGNLNIDGSTRISLRDILQQHTDDTSSNPYLSDRNERVDAAKERIAVLQCQTDGIQPEVFISLRHAMSIDAEGLAGIYNSYVRSSGYTLDSKPITADKMCKHIDESRQQELPFIVAIKQDPDKEFENRHPWGLILGFVRLTKFLSGDSVVTNAAQLEIMVARTAQGRSVGRCLMDAMMTIADPHYSPRGGYTFHSDVPNDTMINCGSWSCRPLSRIVMLLSHISQEADRCRRVKNWLVTEHHFCEQGYLPSIGQKMCQSLSISILVREV